MGTWTKVTAADGHELGAYVATPAQPPIGAIVIVQEIFGVNPSIQAVADSYAAEGFLAIAPELFDRFAPHVQLGYDEADMKQAYGFYPRLQPETTLLDVAAAFALAKQAGKGTGVLGFCYGGLAAWLSAVRGEDYTFKPDCIVGYYAGGIGKFASEEPVCPASLHFGSADDHIGPDQIDAVRTAHPEVEIHLYEGAVHAFANPARPSYNEPAATLARTRSLAFLKTHLA